MIYTIGYSKLTPQRIMAINEALGATLVDVRFNPISRKPGFGRRQLEERFGPVRYLHKGDVLGGRQWTGKTHVTDEGIKWLRRCDEQGWNMLLMCVEEAPEDCHRHHDICWPYFPDALHIFQDELVSAAHLQSAIDTGPDADYKIDGNLRDIMQ